MFSSDRHFHLVSYQASHGILLFRSPKRRRNAATNIDVLFTDVRAVELRAWTEGLVVEEVDAGAVADATSRPADLIEPGNRVYRGARQRLGRLHRRRHNAHSRR